MPDLFTSRENQLNILRAARKEIEIVALVATINYLLELYSVVTSTERDLDSDSDARSSDSVCYSYSCIIWNYMYIVYRQKSSNYIYVGKPSPSWTWARHINMLYSITHYIDMISSHTISEFSHVEPRSELRSSATLYGVLGHTFFWCEMWMNRQTHLTYSTVSVYCMPYLHVQIYTIYISYI